MSIESVQAVIWDMDGVIIDTEDFWPQAERAALTKVGVPHDEDFENATTGLRSIDVVRFWHERYPWSTDQYPFEQLSGEVTQKMREFVEREGEPLPHIHDTLQFFHEKGMQQAIASSSPRFLIESVMQKLDIERFITSHHSGEDEKQGKPAPDVYLTAAQHIGVKPRQCLVIEDSYNGALAGSRAGMQVVIVPDMTVTDEQKMRKFKEIENSILVASLHEVRALLEL